MEGLEVINNICSINLSAFFRFLIEDQQSLQFSGRTFLFMSFSLKMITPSHSFLDDGWKPKVFWHGDGSTWPATHGHPNPEWPNARNDLQLALPKSRSHPEASSSPGLRQQWQSPRRSWPVTRPAAAVPTEELQSSQLSPTGQVESRCFEHHPGVLQSGRLAHAWCFLLPSRQALFQITVSIFFFFLPFVQIERQGKESNFHWLEQQELKW